MTSHTNLLARISDSSSSSSSSSTRVPALPATTTTTTITPTTTSSSYVPEFKSDLRPLTLPRTHITTNNIVNDLAQQIAYPNSLSNYVQLINNNSNLRSTPSGLAESPESVNFLDQLHYNGMNGHLMNIPSFTPSNFNPCSNPTSFNKCPSLGGAQSELDLNSCRYSQGSISSNPSQNQNQNQNQNQMMMMMMMMMMNGGRPSGFTREQWIEFTQQAYIFKNLCNYGYNPNPSPILHAYNPNLPYAQCNPFLCFNGDYQPHPGLGLDMDERKLLMMMMMMRNGSNGGSIDPEPGRCRRTDGKKWRCSRDVVPEQKYCERHLHRGRHRAARSKLNPSANSDAAANPSANPAANPPLIPLNPSLISANHAVNPSLTTPPPSGPNVSVAMAAARPSQMSSRSRCHGALDATNPSLAITNPVLLKHYPSTMNNQSSSQYQYSYGAQKDQCGYAMNPPHQLLQFSLGTSASSTSRDHLPIDRSGSSNSNMVLSDPSELRTLVLEQNMANNLEAQSQQSLLLKKTITNSWLRDDYQEDDNEEEEEEEEEEEQHRSKRKFQSTMANATTNTDLSISLKAPRSLSMAKARGEEEMVGTHNALPAIATDYDEESDGGAILDPYIGLNLGTAAKFRREGSMWWESSPLAEALQISSTPNPSPCLEEQGVWEYHHHHHHHHHHQQQQQHSHSHSHSSHSISATNFSGHCDFLINNASSSTTTKDSGSSPSLASPTGVLQIKSYSDSSSNSAISSPRSSGPKLDSNTTPPPTGATTAISWSPSSAFFP